MFELLLASACASARSAFMGPLREGLVQREKVKTR